MAIAILSVCLYGISQTVPKAHATPAAEERIDINHATAVELLKVPGMTSTWAERIVRFRPYRTKQDLLDQGVVTGEVYDRIKDYVIAHRDKR
jgi:DNA uptake protein ComE-like DNA-binding protein